jgi:hypothetical protein
MKARPIRATAYREDTTMVRLRLGLHVGPFIVTSGPPRPRVPFMPGPLLIGLAVPVAVAAGVALAWWLS